MLFRCFSLLLAVTMLGGAGVNAAPGQDEDKDLPSAAPVLEGKIPEKIEQPTAPAPAVSLEPFFLIMEEGSRVRVRRVQVALEFSQPEILLNFDPQAPALREIVYDSLMAKDQAHSGREKKEQEKVLTQLINRYLGREAVSAVKVDQSFLLLR